MMDVIYPKARAFLGSRGWVSGLELKIYNECLVHLNSYFLQFTRRQQSKPAAHLVVMVAWVFLGPCIGEF